MASISTEVLLKLGGGLDPGSKPIPMSVVFTRPEVRSEVTGVREKGPFPGNTEETGGGEVMAGKGTREDDDKRVSSSEEVLVPDTPSGPLLISECAKPCLTAALVSTQEAMGDVSKGSVSRDVASRGPIWAVMIISAGSAMMGEVESLEFSVERPGIIVDRTGPEMGVLLEEMTSVLEPSVVPPVGTLESTVIGSGAELLCWVGLVSLRPGVREGADSVSILVVSEE